MMMQASRSWNKSMWRTAMASTIACLSGKKRYSPPTDSPAALAICAVVSASTGTPPASSEDAADSTRCTVLWLRSWTGLRRGGWLAMAPMYPSCRAATIDKLAAPGAEHECDVAFAWCAAQRGEPRSTKELAVPVPLNQLVRVGAYVIGQHLRGRRRYPLVLMLEPLFRCNLACAGCGKIDYPEAILNQRLSVQDCLDAVDECGAPVVAIAGGEPLLHRELPEIVAKILARGKFVYLCTNGLLLEKKLDQYRPHRNFAWDVHLDGDRDMHDQAVSQPGTYDRAVAAIRAAKARGFRVCINTTLFDGAEVGRVAAFMDDLTAIGIDGVMISPGYAYERAPDREHFLNRQKSKQLFRDIFRLGRGRGWKFNQSSLFLDFLAGNQRYLCTPGASPPVTCSAGSGPVICSARAMPRPMPS